MSAPLRPSVGPECEAQANTPARDQMLDRISFQLERYRKARVMQSHMSHVPQRMVFHTCPAAFRDQRYHLQPQMTCFTHALSHPLAHTFALAQDYWGMNLAKMPFTANATNAPGTPGELHISKASLVSHT